jgi:hypothetical protein
MSEQKSKRYLVFGLSGAGKSTFAAALWHLVDSHEIPTVLAKGKHSGNFRYLEKIAKRWCDGWRLERTKSEEVEDVSINLLHEETGVDFTLEFRDIAGESLERAFSTRYCDPDFVDLVKNAHGMLLFVSADRKMDDATILDVRAQTGNDAEADNDEDDDGDEDEDAEADDDQIKQDLGEGPPALEDQRFDPEKVPLQVRLVDLLQSLRLNPFNSGPFRIVVIISAWDLAKGASGDAWLAEKMPLLDQFLRGGEVADAVRVYGVSAQGGMFAKKGDKDDEDRKEIMRIRPASARIRVEGHGAGKHDLTHPVRWLSGLEGKN